MRRVRTRSTRGKWIVGGNCSSNRPIYGIAASTSEAAVFGFTLTQTWAILPWGSMRNVLRFAIVIPANPPSVSHIRAHDFVVGVGQQMECESILGAELLVAVDRVNADAQDHGILGIELRQRVLELVRLNGAAGGHVLGIEVEDHPLAAIAIERDLLADLRGQREGGRGLADGGHVGVVSADGDERDRGDKRQSECEKKKLFHGKTS